MAQFLQITEGADAARDHYRRAAELAKNPQGAHEAILTASDDTPTHTGLTLDEAKARGLLPEDWEKRGLEDGGTGRRGD